MYAMPLQSVALHAHAYELLSRLFVCDGYQTYGERNLMHLCEELRAVPWEQNVVGGGGGGG